MTKQDIINKYQSIVDNHLQRWFETDLRAVAVSRINLMIPFLDMTGKLQYDPYGKNNENVVKDYYTFHKDFWATYQWFKASLEEGNVFMPNPLTDKVGYNTWVANLPAKDKSRYKKAVKCMGWRPLKTEANRMVEARVRKLTIARNKELRAL